MIDRINKLLNKQEKIFNNTKIENEQCSKN